MRQHRTLRWSALALVAAVVLGGIHAWRTGARSAPPARDALAGANHGQEVLRRAALRETERRLAQMAAAMPAAPGVGKFSAEELESAQNLFRRMLAAQGLITQERERRDLAQLLLATANGAELARETLLAPGFAKEAFGDFQAEARFFSIVVLDEAARQGQLYDVTATSSALAKQLAATEGELDPGRSEDLIGLATVIGRTSGSAAFQDTSSPIVAQLAFFKTLPENVQELMVKGIFQGVWKAEGIKSAQQVAEQMWNL